MKEETPQWEKEFDKEFPDPMTKKYGEGFKLYCSNCNGGNLQKIKDFISSQIIEKIIGDYDEALSLEEIGYLTKDRVKQLKDKWL